MTLTEHAQTLRGRVFPWTLKSSRLREAVKLPVWSVFAAALPAVEAAAAKMTTLYKTALAAAAKADWKTTVLNLAEILAEVAKLAPMVLPGVAGEIGNLDRYAAVIRSIGANIDQAIADVENLEKGQNVSEPTYLLTPDLLSQGLPVYIKALAAAAKKKKRYWVYQKLGHIVSGLAHALQAFSKVGLPYDNMMAADAEFAAAEKQAVAQDRY